MADCPKGDPEMGKGRGINLREGLEMFDEIKWYFAGLATVFAALIAYNAFHIHFLAGILVFGSIFFGYTIFHPSETSQKNKHSEPHRPRPIKHTKSYVPPAPHTLNPILPPKPVNHLNWSINLLQSLEWKRFEILCKEYLSEKGCEARMSRVGADGGIDFTVHSPNQEKPIALGQCKAWNSYKVGVKPVRELFGVMAAERVPNGIFLTTGRFTEEALTWSQGKPLQLVNGDEFIKLIHQLPEDKQARLLKVATAGDYKTPTCPQCDIKMVLRTSRKGKAKGSTFWGCRNYPKCHQKFIAPKDEH